MCRRISSLKGCIFRALSKAYPCHINPSIRLYFIGQDDGTMSASLICKDMLHLFIKTWFWDNGRLNQLLSFCLLRRIKKIFLDLKIGNHSFLRSISVTIPSCICYFKRKKDICRYIYIHASLFSFTTLCNSFWISTAFMQSTN